MATTDVNRPAAAAARPLARKRLRPADGIFHGVVLGAVLVSVAVLVWLFASILIDGASALTTHFLTDKTSKNPSRAGFNTAIRGSFVLMMITVAVALPIGVGAAIYLEKLAARDGVALRGRLDRRAQAIRAQGTEGRSTAQRIRLGWIAVCRVWARVIGPVNRFVEINISNLAAVPSIIYGLLGLGVIVAVFGVPKSLLAGGLTLAMLVLPIIIIASREAIRAVPPSIEQGALALGATRLQAVTRQVVPAAIPGILTGSILAMSRAIGEAAPLIVVGGAAFTTKEINVNPAASGDQTLVAMPLQIYNWAVSPRPEFRELAAAGIIVLLGTLLLMNAIAIYLRNRFSRRW
jgi:phosphate transport system permease protein